MLLGACVTLCSLITSLFLGEAFVRLYLHLNSEILPIACRREDPILHHSLVPNKTCRFKTSEWNVVYHINSMGLRDREYSYQKPPAAYRILILGDSFAEGYGVDEPLTYQNQLEEMLNQPSNQLYEVINAGVQSYSPTLEDIYLQKYSVALNPDLVILHLDITDFSDEQRYSKQYVNGRWQYPVLFQESIPSVTWAPFMSTKIKWWLHQHSQLYDLSLRTIKKKINPTAFPDQVGFTQNDPQTDSFIILRDLKESEYQRLWQPIRDRLLSIKRLLDEENIKFMVIMPPHGHQITKTGWEKGRSRWRFNQDQVYSTRPQQDLEAFAKANELTYVNLLSIFTRSSDKRILFFANDGHLTAAGHYLVAQSLFNALK